LREPEKGAEKVLSVTSIRDIRFSENYTGHNRRERRVVIPIIDRTGEKEHVHHHGTIVGSGGANMHEKNSGNKEEEDMHIVKPPLHFCRIH